MRINLNADRRGDGNWGSVDALRWGIIGHNKKEYSTYERTPSNPAVSLGEHLVWIDLSESGDGL